MIGLSNHFFFLSFFKKQSCIQHPSEGLFWLVCQSVSPFVWPAVETVHRFIVACLSSSPFVSWSAIQPVHRLACQSGSSFLSWSGRQSRNLLVSQSVVVENQSVNWSVSQYVGQPMSQSENEFVSQSLWTVKTVRTVKQSFSLSVHFSVGQIHLEQRLMKSEIHFNNSQKLVKSRFYCISGPIVQQCTSQFHSTEQDVSHGFDVLGSIVRCMTLYRIVSTRVEIVSLPSCSKTDFGISACAILLAVSKDTNSCFWKAFSTGGGVEAFFITVGLQGRLRANQSLPRVTTQWGGAVFAVSDQCEQRVGLLLDDKELDLLADLHTEADLGEGCVPVGRQLGLLRVKSSLASCQVVGISVAPKPRIVMAVFLKYKQEWVSYKLSAHKVGKNGVNRRQLIPFCGQSS